jgi:Uma2 family endonuclease
LTEANVQGPPDLVIEILSAGDKKRDTIKKKAIYEKYGVKEYWIVDPDTEVVSVFVLEKNLFKEREIYKKDQALESPLLPEFSLVLEEVYKAAE